MVYVQILCSISAQSQSQLLQKQQKRVCIPACHIFIYIYYKNIIKLNLYTNSEPISEMLNLGFQFTQYLQNVPIRSDPQTSVTPQVQLHQETPHTPAVEQGKQFSGVVQVVAGHTSEAEGVEVAQGDGGELQLGGSHLIQLGDVRVLEVELHPVHAHQHQNTQRAQEEENPQAALDAHPLVSEHVRDAVQRGPAGENFNGCWLFKVHVLRVRLQIHDVTSEQPWAAESEINPNAFNG